jgi:hypothetical protein
MDFAARNGLSGEALAFAGRSYLDVCDRAAGPGSEGAAAEAPRALA